VSKLGCLSVSDDNLMWLLLAWGRGLPDVTRVRERGIRQEYREANWAFEISLFKRGVCPLSASSVSKLGLPSKPAPDSSVAGPLLGFRPPRSVRMAAALLLVALLATASAWCCHGAALEAPPPYIVFKSFQPHPMRCTASKPLFTRWVVKPWTCLLSGGPRQAFVALPC
jgi:hypothetical protein